MATGERSFLRAVAYSLRKKILCESAHSRLPGFGVPTSVFPRKVNETLRGFVFCFMLITLTVIGAGLVRASVACLDATSDHVAAESISSKNHADGKHSCKHAVVPTCCAHGGFTSLSALEPVGVDRDSLCLVFSPRADPPPTALAPAPELAPPRFASA